MRYCVLQVGTSMYPRGVCSLCGDDCFVRTDGLSSCCTAEVKELVGNAYSTRKIGSKGKRKQPSAEAKATILAKQSYRCFWCGRDFGRYVTKAGTGIAHKLRPVWDHYVPYAYTESSSDDQFVAACRICNGFKSAKLPIEEESLRELLKRKWQKAGWVDL